jgi:hypothetical protein
LSLSERKSEIVIQQEQTDKKWNQIDGSYPLGQEVTVNITKLKAKTKYNVRTVITTGDNGNKERWTTITTKCLEISKESVSLEVSNSTANISFLKSVHKDICRFTECEVYLKGKEAKISQQYIFVNNLTPFREYNVSIRCDSQETLIRFRTTEGIPEKISKLNFVDISPDSLCLEWDVPKRINGVFSHYIVEYQMSKSFDSFLITYLAAFRTQSLQKLVRCGCAIQKRDQRVENQIHQTESLLCLFVLSIHQQHLFSVNTFDETLRNSCLRRYLRRRNP